jgi:glycopeptide antibiotics resistance protein
MAGAAVGLVVVTVSGLLLAGVVARAGRGRPRGYRLAEALMIAGTLPWLFLILRPGHQPQHVYVIPFTDLRDQFRVGLGFAAEQIGGNLLVFAAFGFAAPVRWRLRSRCPRPLVVLGIAALASAALELTQLVLGDGRVASVDDVLVNAVGAGLAALLSRRWWRGSRDSWTGVDRSGTTLSPGAGTVSQR